MNSSNLSCNSTPCLIIHVQPNNLTFKTQVLPFICPLHIKQERLCSSPRRNITNISCTAEPCLAVEVKYCYFITSGFIHFIIESFYRAPTASNYKSSHCLTDCIHNAADIRRHDSPTRICVLHPSCVNTGTQPM